MPIWYYLHMEGQFIYIRKLVQPLKIENGSRYSLQVSVRENLYRSNGDTRKCVELSTGWDMFWYKIADKAMENCTVPWAMNNSKICEDKEAVENAFKIYKNLKHVSCEEF